MDVGEYRGRWVWGNTGEDGCGEIQGKMGVGEYRGRWVWGNTGEDGYGGIQGKMGVGEYRGRYGVGGYRGRYGVGGYRGRWVWGDTGEDGYGEGGGCYSQEDKVVAGTFVVLSSLAILCICNWPYFSVASTGHIVAVTILHALSLTIVILCLLLVHVSSEAIPVHASVQQQSRRKFLLPEQTES